MLSSIEQFPLLPTIYYCKRDHTVIYRMGKKKQKQVQPNPHPEFHFPAVDEASLAALFTLSTERHKAVLQSGVLTLTSTLPGTLRDEVNTSAVNRVNLESAGSFVFISPLGVHVRTASPLPDKQSLPQVLSMLSSHNSTIDLALERLSLISLS